MTLNHDDARKPSEENPEASAPAEAPQDPLSTPEETTEAAAEETPTTEAGKPAEKPEAEAVPEEPKAEEPVAEKPEAEIAAEVPKAEEPAAEKPEAEAPRVEMAPVPESGEKAAASVASDEDEPAPDPAATAAMEQAAAAAPAGPTLKPGKRMKVTLVQVGEKDSFVDFGGRSEGTIATSELKDEKGELKHNVGDELSLVVRKGGDSPVFTLGRRKVPANLGKVKEAFESGVPMEGKIKSTNKGGFEVDLGGVRAFCPYSQIQLGYCDKPDEYVGQKLPFQVITFERGGRNIVVSRRKLLEAEAKEQAQETVQNLEVGAEFEGVVRRLQPYGAFVDIGGLDGLVHVSEISHGRISNPSDVLEVGQKVRVKVIRLEGEGDKRRISLSMKELTGDPWEGIQERYQEGATVAGKVVRLAEFGAFVELEPGIDGLVHISEISTERIQHPGDKLQRGQDVEVRVLNVDDDQRRISLSLLSEEESSASQGRRGPGGGGGPREHRSSTDEGKREPRVDVTKMPLEDAIQALKNKFEGS